MLVQSLIVCLVVSKFDLYRFLAPFRSRRQKQLREKRKDVTWEVFSSRIESGPRHNEITWSVWNNLREEQAFVEDFKPDPQDNLSNIYGIGPEEIRYDMIVPIAK